MAFWIGPDASKLPLRARALLSILSRLVPRHMYLIFLACFIRTGRSACSVIERLTSLAWSVTDHWVSSLRIFVCSCGTSAMINFFGYWSARSREMTKCLLKNGSHQVSTCSSNALFGYIVFMEINGDSPHQISNSHLLLKLLLVLY
jgi:hypothetical protein